jgi:hypothetical protein
VGSSEGVDRGQGLLSVGSTSVATMHAIVLVVLILFLLCKVLQF